MRTSEKVVVADIALGPGISFITVAVNEIVAVGNECALICMTVTGGDRIGTTARPTTVLASEKRISVVAFNTSVAVSSGGEVSAVVTFASLRVAGRCVTVAVARLTRREVPVTSLTLVASPSVCLRMTITVTSLEVTLVVF